MFRNTMPRYEVLSEDAMATLDAGWRRLVTEIGVEFMDDRALELFRKAGQRVEDNTVFLDPDFVLEQVAKAPREFDVQARNPEQQRPHRRRLDGVRRGLRPAVRARGRRTPRRDDGRLPQLHQARPVVRRARLRRRRDLRAQRHPARLPAPRHDLRAADADRQDLHGQRRLGRQRRATPSRWASILFGGREAIEETPASISLINCNSPLRWDDRMLEAQFEYSAAGQPVVLTPFILMGAMSPVTIPAALVQQIAEALSGIALSQLIRPGHAR